MTGTLPGTGAGAPQVRNGPDRGAQDRPGQDRPSQDRAGQDRAALAARRPVARDSDGPRRGEKSPQAFRTISEVAQDLEVPPHVLRFWETKFSQVRPLKRGGGRRYYRPEDVDLLRRIRALLYREGYTIKGVQRVLREGGSYAAEGAAGRGGAGPDATLPSAGEAAQPDPPTPPATPRAVGPAGAAAEPQPAVGQPAGKTAPGTPESVVAEAAMAAGGGDAASLLTADAPDGEAVAALPGQAAAGPGGQATPPVADRPSQAAAGTAGIVDPGAAPAAREQDWRQRLGKVLLDLRTVREVLQRERHDPSS